MRQRRGYILGAVFWALLTAMIALQPGSVTLPDVLWVPGRAWLWMASGLGLLCALGAASGWAPPWLRR